jgi:hypothetical protein
MTIDEELKSVFDELTKLTKEGTVQWYSQQVDASFQVAGCTPCKSTKYTSKAYNELSIIGDEFFCKDNHNVKVDQALIDAVKNQVRERENKERENNIEDNKKYVLEGLRYIIKELS